ncbi:hypothetical protein ACHAXR_000315 [Thalassiosira sp. AJA248-18]
MIIIQNTAVDAGAPPREWNEEDWIWTLTPVRFHGFEGLGAARGACVESAEFKCYGHQWCLGINPGGCAFSDEGMVSVYLRNISEESIEVEFGFVVKKQGAET